MESTSKTGNKYIKAVVQECLMETKIFLYTKSLKWFQQLYGSGFIIFYAGLVNWFPLYKGEFNLAISIPVY